MHQGKAATEQRKKHAPKRINDGGYFQNRPSVKAQDVKVGKKTTTQEVSQKKSDPVEREGKSCTSSTGPGTKGSRPPRASRRPYPRRLPSSITTKGKNLQVGGKRKTRNPHIPIPRKKHPSLPLSLSGQGETKIRRQAISSKRRDPPAEREHNCNPRRM